MTGFVYIMSNEAMPGIYKIGCTSRKPDERSEDLYTTGVPLPFTVEYCIYIESYQFIERLIHRSLSQYRINKDREFFKYDLIKCILELKRIAIEHSSYKEKYRTRHLRSIIEGWEKKYFEELEGKKQERLARDAEERRIRREQEARDAEEQLRNQQLEIKLKKEQEESKRGCIILVVSFVIGTLISQEVKSMRVSIK